jgi:histidine triad (HIT) family protein
MTDYDSENIFAKILRGEIPSHQVHGDDHTLVIMDVMPRCDGHCLVLSKAPARNILDITSDDWAHVAEITRRVSRAAQVAFHADGLTIQQNSELAGGQMVFHLHVHIMPRLDGAPLGPAASEMADGDLLANHAQRIRDALALS